MECTGRPFHHQKIRVLIISLGGKRQKFLKDDLFQHPTIQAHFETPTFISGVPSRLLRSRYSFLKVANEAGLLPEAEWTAIQEYESQHRHCSSDQWSTECFVNVPVTTKGRQGSASDRQLHYSIELWRKAKTVNRGRAVLACTMAHLIALRKLVEEKFDILLEDNVRMPIDSCVDRIIATLSSQLKPFHNNNGDNGEYQRPSCHLRYFGWLGSVTNMEWIFNAHARRFQSTTMINTNGHQHETTIFPFPTKEAIERDLLTGYRSSQQNSCQPLSADASSRHSTPGGTAVWGAYAYWISNMAYELLMETLRSDVGSMLWKGKRARYYQVKPIDKIIPRKIISTFGTNAVLLSATPAFFRAPMLNSHIHTQFDAAFCISTDYQLAASGLSWEDMYLTSEESTIVNHYKNTNQWISFDQLRQATS
jgi:hypothetical protein